MAELLKPEAVQVLLEEVPEWKLSDNSIERTLTFDGFPAAIEFVIRLATEAEEMNHHPDIDIRWNKVKLVLSTHSAGGLTDQDFLLARKIDKLKGDQPENHVPREGRPLCRPTFFFQITEVGRHGGRPSLCLSPQKK
jgi:4a-hydroxytetrahydrobiopterin dehydratase